MAKIHLNELLGQLAVCKRRYNSLEGDLHSGEPETHAKAVDARRRLKDRIRVIEDRIIDYEPDPAKSAPQV